MIPREVQHLVQEVCWYCGQVIRVSPSLYRGLSFVVGETVP